MLKKLAERAIGKIFSQDFSGVFLTQIHEAVSTPFSGRTLIAGYHTFKWLKAVVNKIAETGSAVEWVATKDGEIVTHPLVDALNMGNQAFPGLTVRLLALKYLCILDECHLLKERNSAGKVIALWPLPSHDITRRPVLGIGIYEVRIGGKLIIYEAEDVIGIVSPDPERPYGAGKGIGASLGDDFETELFTTRFTKNFFRNSARPDLLITAADKDTPLDKDAAKRMEKKWLQKLRGVARSSVPYFLSGGKVDIKELNKDFDKLAMKDMKALSRDAVLQVYGFPPEALGIIENSNRATIEAAELFLTKHVVMPKLALIRSVFQLEINKTDPSIKINFINPVKDDTKDKIDLMKTRPEAFTLNEIRKAAGEEMVDGLDLHPVPFNISFEDTPAEDGEQSPPSGVAFFLPIKDGPPEIILPKDHYKQIEKGPDDIGDIFAAIDGESPGAKTTGILSDTVGAFGDDVFNQVGMQIAFDVNDPNVVAFLRDYSSTRITDIQATTKKRVAKTLARGRAAGESVRELSKRVQRVFDVRVERAGTIARTENVRAANFGTQEAMQQAGVEEKMWLTTQDVVVRDSHVNLSGQIKDVSDEFIGLSGAGALYPGDFGIPGEDINCRCHIISVTPTSRGALDTEEKRAGFWKVFEARRAQFERKLRREYRRSFMRQEQAVLEIINS